MKNYELIAKLSELPAGAEVMCSGCETIDNFTSMIWETMNIQYQEI